jgi:hypothetical protein
MSSVFASTLIDFELLESGIFIKQPTAGGFVLDTSWRFTIESQSVGNAIESREFEGMWKF